VTRETRPQPSHVDAARRGLFVGYRRQGTSSWIQVTGGSMRPLIGPGTWVLVDFGATPQHAGEIVLFVNRGAMVVHRIAGVRRPPRTGTIATKGDAVLRFDPPLEVEDILGVIRARRRADAAPARAFGCVGVGARAFGAVSTALGMGAGWIRRGVRRG
jgi:signal peptidase I